jgi:hypothetical protein
MPTVAMMRLIVASRRHAITPDRRQDLEGNDGTDRGADRVGRLADINQRARAGWRWANKIWR